MNETAETMRKCTNCCRGPQPLGEFASARDASVLVKRCAKCRAKDGKQKRKPEVREIRNARGREHKYYETYREKKREENEEEFLKHNTDVMKAWRDKHPEYHKALQKNVLSVRVSILKSSSKVRCIRVDLTDDEISAIVLGDCVYCGKPSEPGDFNGVDRMDSAKGYEKINAVSCCQTCNFMKGSLDPFTFIEKCAAVANHACNEHFKYDGPACSRWMTKRDKTEV
jgi:hypothetical protein